jgi:hypothetical protein
MDGTRRTPTGRGIAWVLCASEDHVVAGCRALEPSLTRHLAPNVVVRAVLQVAATHRSSRVYRFCGIKNDILAPPDMWRIIVLSVVWSVLGVILISVPLAHMYPARGFKQGHGGHGGPSGPPAAYTDSDFGVAWSPAAFGTAGTETFGFACIG